MCMPKLCSLKSLYRRNWGIIGGKFTSRWQPCLFAMSHMHVILRREQVSYPIRRSQGKSNYNGQAMCNECLQSLAETPGKTTIKEQRLQWTLCVCVRAQVYTSVLVMLVSCI